MLTDYHVHLRPDDEGTPPARYFTPANADRYRTVAAERGIEELGVAEHIYRFSQALEVWDHPFWRHWAVDDLDDYCAFVRSDTDLRLGIDVGVILSDTFGRPWRDGQTDVAIGAAGLRVVDDLRGSTDSQGRVLEVTVPAIADELAGAADLVKGKATGRPVKFVEDRVDNLAANDNVGPDRVYDAELAVAEDGTFLSLRLGIVDDYGAVAGQVNEFLMNKQFGLEQFYEIVRKGTD